MSTVPPKSNKWNPFRKTNKQMNKPVAGRPGITNTTMATSPKHGLVRKLQGSFRKSKPKTKGAPTPVKASGSLPNSPYSQDSYGTDDSGFREEKKDSYGDHPSQQQRQLHKQQYGDPTREVLNYKQRLKERDGFCRRVDKYDGSVISVDGKPAYEIGNYLGGGVAGVVYVGHRLQPLADYPIRKGISDEEEEDEEEEQFADVDLDSPSSPTDGPSSSGFFCSPVDLVQTTGEVVNCGGDDDFDTPATSPSSQTGKTKTKGKSTGKDDIPQEYDVAIEATVSHNEHGVMLDAQDAPSRSKHFTKAASVKLDPKRPTVAGDLQHGLTEEAVAVKILNPVGFRIMQADGLNGSVVVKKGETMDWEVKKGTRPMQEKHVWWLVNPNSRNLRTLRRYNGKSQDTMSIQVDRGSVDKGLRLSLIAAYIDPRTNQLRELTLTRCIEIWGHIPFNATDSEFDDMMTAIERVNAGQPPPSVNAFDDHPPARVGADVTGASSGDEVNLHSPVKLKNARTGLIRAALTERKTVKCDELNAYIAIPAVPSKYLRWLRQRRAATKEIRNMMSIGRHKNVLHLFEVLEFIQESKSTMFLILELVKGGELFDLISSAGKNRKNSSSKDTAESEQMMRKFFFELASGIHYCHKNGIAHRDLKPENLLVHTPKVGQATLKIADFGLSAAFGPNGRAVVTDNDTVLDSMASPLSQQSSSFSPREGDGLGSPSSQNSGTSLKESVDKIIASSASALSFLTCGAMESGLCFPNGDTTDGVHPLRRMTSVVGSPHYVAPEIISQSAEKSKRNKSTDGIASPRSSGSGYDGAKADVWSAGVILYAMLFRSLPFGEDLLRCPRFLSYKKWYEEIRLTGGRRSSAQGALTSYISDADEREQLGPHWFFPAATSKESRDLIVAMLNPKPEDRLSVEQVLQHSWVAGGR